MKKFFLIPLMALCSCVMAFADDADRFSLSIESNGVQINAVMDHDYNFTLALPDQMAQMSAGEADVVFNGRTRHISTGLTNTVTIGTSLPKMYAFTTATIAATVKADGQTKQFTYNLGKSGNNLVANPTSKEQVKEAVELMKAEMVRTSNDAGSYLYIAPGSYLRYGTETITFTDGFRVFDGTWDAEHIVNKYENLYNTYRTEDATMTADESYAIELYLKEGSVIAMGSRKGTLKHEVTATFDLSGMSDGYKLKNRFKSIHELLNSFSDYGVTQKNMLLVAVFKMLDNFAGDINHAGNIPANIIFAEDPIISFNYREGLNIGQFYTLTIDRPLISLEGASLWEIAKFESAYPRLELVEALAPVAGMPYIVIADSTAIRATAYRDATIEQFGQNNNGLYGVLEGDATDLVSGIACKQLTTGDYMVQNNQYGPVGTTAYVRPGRAYIKLAEVSPVDPDPAALVGRRRMALGGGNKVPTGIVTTEEATTAAKTIVDEQLIIIRDGVKYNAQGAVVE